jgi:glycosyltransferase involved in cell wall biosynthesis
LKPVVLQLVDSFNQGGSERQALQLTRLLHESGRFEIRLACLNPNGSLRNQIADLDLGEIPSFPLNSFYDANAIKQLRWFVRWLKDRRIDILHTHDFYTNVFGMFGGSLARLPVRVASMRETAGMRTGAQKQAQRIAYSLAHNVVANSVAVRERLIESGVKAEKITVLYNGLDGARLGSSLSRASALASLGLAENNGRQSAFVTIVANMRHEIKNYPMFLGAARRVREAVPEAAFLLAGEGELTDSLRALAKEAGIADATFFLGRCERIAELLSVSSVCVLSSKAEGFSNSILEYMAAARPVVATDVGGAREAIVEGETGYLVSSGDERAMAEKVIALLRAPEQAQLMGERGRQVVEQKFSCEAQLRRTEELYDRLLRQRGTR